MNLKYECSFLCYTGDMTWQEWVLTVGQIIFVFALLPTILGKDKPAFSTSIINGTILAIFAFTYLQLLLPFAGTLSATLSVCWYILAIQKKQIDKKH